MPALRALPSVCDDPRPIDRPIDCPMPGDGPTGLVGTLRRRLGLVRRSADGQATAEYALVMLAAAGLAGMVLAWAVGGNGVERLMDAVMDSIISEVTE
ncbi:MAG: DUF4244 domain-containing protein [Acidimicrobiales bacterium]